MTKTEREAVAMPQPEKLIASDHIEPLSLQGLRRLLAQVPYVEQPYYRLRLLMGLSHEEAIAVRWADLHESEGFVLTGTPPRKVALAPNLLSWLPPEGAPEDRLLSVRPLPQMQADLDINLQVEQLPPWSLERIHENFPILQLQYGETVERVAEQMGVSAAVVRARYGRYYRPKPFGIGLAAALENYDR